VSGLRERKKQQTREHIVRTAEALFAEQGLEGPTMEDLAAAADVAVATLYNYFGSKLALQMAVFETEAADIVARGEAVLGDPGEDPESAVVRLFHAHIDGFLAIDRRLLRDVFHTGFGGDLLPGLVDLDLLLLEQIRDLLGSFTERGRIAGDGLEDSALLLYSALITTLLFFLTIEAIGPEDTRDQVERLVARAFRGLNES
jgi:AcrR family transcriptional regulator